MFLITKNYNFRNRNVLVRADWKNESKSAFLSESGRVFHDVARCTEENAQSPYVTEFTVGTVKVIWRINEDFVVDDIIVTGTTNRPDKVRQESWNK